MAGSEILHAGLIALRQGGVWRGVLIAGPSGAGKSDLMLRALDNGFRLVADDRTVVWTSGGGVFGRAPATLAGLIEARGLGITAASVLPFAPISLVARCADPDERIERLPEPSSQIVAGVATPLIAIHPLEASTPAKLGRALSRLGGQGGAA